MGMLPQTPSAPPPFFAAVHATHAPVQAVLQHTPSAQWPLAQSVSALYCLPCAQVVPQVPAAPPPQSTSVSVPFFVPLLQFSVEKQLSLTVPHVFPCAEQSCMVQPQVN